GEPKIPERSGWAGKNNPSSVYRSCALLLVAASEAGASGLRSPARPNPRSIRPGNAASKSPNSAATDQEVRCPASTAPEPSRIREVTEPANAMVNAGE